MADNPASITNVSITGNTASFQRSGGKSAGRIYDAAKRCGYAQDGGIVPDQYLVKIMSMDSDKENPVQSLVVAVLQERVNFSVNSNWKSFVPDIKHSDLLNTAAQLLLKSSTYNAFSSRQIWSGTSPIRMNLQLKFQAINEGLTYREVVQPCEVLQEIASPGRGPMGFLLPPGPNPFFSEFLMNYADQQEGVYGRAAVDYFAGGGVQTYIQIGTMLTFPSVIVRSAEVDFDSRVTKEGLPISSLVKIVFDTYQIYTKEDLRSAYGGWGA